MIQRHKLDRNSLVIEAGSNDGSLLWHYREAGVPVLGIEPSLADAKVARQLRGVPTREAPFSRPLADRLAAQGLHCDLFHAHGVLAHVPDVNGFVRGIRRVLKPDGLSIVEVPYVRDLLDDCAPGGIDQVQQNYFSLTSLCQCFSGNGLLIVDVERLPIHGGLLRLYAMPARPAVWPATRVAQMLVAEEAWGVRSFETYARLGQHVEEVSRGGRPRMSTSVPEVA
jgi:SAM-dependent methyltransferase